MGATALAAVLAWLVAYPLVVMAIETLHGPAGWSLDPIARFAGDGRQWHALWNTLWIAVATVVAAAMIGVPLAFVTELYDFPGRGLLGALAALPIALPPLVGAVALVLVYGEGGVVSRILQWLFGLDGSPWHLEGAVAILLVHAYSMYVYFYLFVRVGLARLDATMIEAAEGLGAGGWRTFTRMTLPLLRPSLFAAAVLTFLMALGSFSAPYVVGGDVRVMTTEIVRTHQAGDPSLALVDAVVLVGLALVGLALLRRTEGRGNVIALMRATPLSPRPIRLPLARWGAAIVGWGVALLLLLPHAVLVLVSFVPPGAWTTQLLPPELSKANYVAVFEEADRLWPIVMSVAMAAVATAGAIVLAIDGGRIVSRHPGRLARVIDGLLSASWALPGTVIAVALLTAFSVDHPATGRWMLGGTFWILPLAYLVRSLPIASRGALQGFRYLDRSLEEAAAALGAHRIRTLRHVTLPILQPALGAAAAIAFVTSLGDFVVSILLHTPATRPISLEMLSAFGDMQLGIAAVYGVLLMVVSATVIVIAERR